MYVTCLFFKICWTFLVWKILQLLCFFEIRPLIYFFQYLAMKMEKWLFFHPPKIQQILKDWSHIVSMSQWTELWPKSKELVEVLVVKNLEQYLLPWQQLLWLPKPKSQFEWFWIEIWTFWWAVSDIHFWPNTKLELIRRDILKLWILICIAMLVIAWICHFRYFIGTKFIYCILFWPSPSIWLFIISQRTKEVKKLRQRLAYGSFAWKSSWIVITFLELCVIFRLINLILICYLCPFCASLHHLV